MNGHKDGRQLDKEQATTTTTSSKQSYRSSPLSCNDVVTTSVKSKNKNNGPSVIDSTPLSSSSSKINHPPSSRIESNGSITNSIPSTTATTSIHPNDWNYSCKIHYSGLKPITSVSHRQQNRKQPVLMSSRINMTSTFMKISQIEEADLYLPVSNRKYSLSINGRPGAIEDPSSLSRQNSIHSSSESRRSNLPMRLQNPKHRVKTSLTSPSSNDDQYDAITRRINSFFNCFEEDNDDDNNNNNDNDNDNDQDDDITGQNSSAARDDDSKLSFLLCSDDAASSTQYFSKTRHQNILGPYNFMVDDVDHCSLRNEDMSVKDLKTLSLQLKLLHLLLQKKTVADEKKVEEDILLAWQLVRNAEQSVRSLSMPSHASMGQQQQQEQEQEQQRMILRRLTETV